MRVNFLLPGYSAVPIGGYKVVYEYANALAARGHEIRVLHPPWCNIKTAVSLPNALRQQIKIALGPVAAARLNNAQVSWFPLAEPVQQIIVPDPREKYIPDADATVATAWTTAPWVSSYGAVKGKPFYLIQHYEAWNGLSGPVDATWKLPLHKIVIARWLMQKAAALGEQGRTTYIPNGMDHERFRITMPLDNRPLRVGMLAHKAPWKGTSDGLAALALVREREPELQVILYGTDEREASLPPWIEYVQLPDPDRLVEIYNSCRLFLHPSWDEGWPAPPAEAMCCGCAVVAAANDGVRDYVEDNVSALLAPIKRPDLLAEQMLRLIGDFSLLRQIATAGHDTLQPYTWQRATDQLEQILESGEAG